MKLVIKIGLLLLLCKNCFAGVNPRVGNFFMTYTDMEFKGTSFTIDRTYSSSNIKTGMFGQGWNSYIETRLVAFPDGTICVKWWGTVSKDFFEPVQKSNNGLFEMLNAIIDYEISQNKLENAPLPIMRRKSDLMADRDMLGEKYLDLIDKNVVKKFVPTSLTNNRWIRNVNQVIVWKDGKYTLQNWKDVYEFSNTGLLTTIREPQFEVKFEYAQQFLRSIRVQDNYVCEIETNDKGQVTKLTSKDSSGIKIAIYKYDSSNNLIYSKDAGDNEYWFEYDGLQNLVRISYADKTSLQVTYDAVTNRAVKVKERDGSYVLYQYPSYFTAEGKLNNLHYETITQNFDSTGKLNLTTEQEFENRLKADGSIYIHRVLEKSDSSYSESVYDPEVGNASYRKKNGREAWAKYDSKARPIYLKIADTIYLCNYDLNNRVSTFMIIDSIRNDSVQYKYGYAENGDLKKVVKNGTLYNIKGNMGAGKIELSRDGEDLEAYFMNKELIGLQNSRLPRQSIDSNYIKKEASKKIELVAIPEFEEMVVNREAGDEKRAAEMEMKYKELRKALNQQSQTKDVRKILMKIYEGEFKDIMEPKLIPHEWIWEKL